MKRLESTLFVLSVALTLALLEPMAVDSASAMTGAPENQSGKATVSGKVEMPDVCSPGISPAVVYLEPIDAKAAPSPSNSPSGTPADVTLMNQRGLQFVPRIQAITPGQVIRFTNEDGETHNVHVVTPGFDFNQSMAPGQTRDYTPDKPGVFKLTCDVHIHMRAFVIVSPSPWYQVCAASGKYRLDGVPDGRYALVAWHEMGDPERKEITISGGKEVEVAPIVLTASATMAISKGPRVAQVIRPWADVIDRIGMTLASSLDEASKPGGLSKARRLAEDAYWGEFEASDMEMAVRKYLGFAHKGDLERRFREIRTLAKEVAEKRQPASEMAEANRKLLLALLATAGDLNKRGAIDAAHLNLPADPSVSVEAAGASVADQVDVADLVQVLKRGFRRIQDFADKGESDEAASEVTSIYTTEFEPIELYLLGREPQAVRPFEVRFNLLRGNLGAGLKGDELNQALTSLQGDVETLVARLEAQPAGTFSAAFLTSFITIFREGVEIILLLAMLIALVAKTTADSPADRRRGMKAIWLGVAAAVGASLLTAVVLNRLISSAQGKTREILEGLVMLSAAGILFYVSYWMISQLESKRWMDFLKRQTRRGVELGGLGTLALTAFLAVYREGAELVLMYQALLGSQGQALAGLWGLAVGLGAGVMLLATIVVIVRLTSVRLPMRRFFAISGLILFALSIVFAGNGVFALQTAGIIATTKLGLLGDGLPLLGSHPNVQVIATQGMILGGALLGWLTLLLRRKPADNENTRQPQDRAPDPRTQRAIA